MLIYISEKFAAFLFKSKMKSITTIALLLCSIVAFGQNKPKQQLITFTVAAPEIGMQVSFTKPQKGYDTTYSAEDNIAYQTIRYKYTEGKTDMQLSVKLWYDGRNWLLRGCEVKPFVNINYGLSLSTPYMLTPTITPGWQY